jgi:hypothetical protein
MILPTSSNMAMARGDVCRGLGRYLHVATNTEKYNYTVITPWCTGTDTCTNMQEKADGGLVYQKAPHPLTCAPMGTSESYGSGVGVCGVGGGGGWAVTEPPALLVCVDALLCNAVGG